MRDKRFVAEHRGGLLTKDNHQKLMKWARVCSEHVMTLIDKDVDNRLRDALRVAKEGENGNVPVGEAMKASITAHTVAKESKDLSSIAIARSVGHAVATAHMADHSLGAALYALKATKNAGKSIDEERKWQEEQLPSEIKEIVLAARKGKKI